MADPVIKIKNLVKRFGDRAVLDGIDIAIPEGKITVIMGGSGCGKSTLLRHLIGLHQPTAGEVWVDGGIRTARDARIAKALGAAEVLIGRPLITALLKFGTSGIADWLANFTQGN